MENHMLTSFFLHPLPDSSQKEHFHSYTGSPTSIPVMIAKKLS